MVKGAWMRYVEQKKKVSEMVRESIRKYERGLTEEIKSNGSSHLEGSYGTIWID